MRGHQSEWPRDSNEAGQRQCRVVSRFISVQARAPTRRKGGRVPCSRSDAQKDQSPTCLTFFERQFSIIVDCKKSSGS